MKEKRKRSVPSDLINWGRNRKWKEKIRCDDEIVRDAVEDSGKNLVCILFYAADDWAILGPFGFVYWASVLHLAQQDFMKLVRTSKISQTWDVTNWLRKILNYTLIKTNKNFQPEPYNQPFPKLKILIIDIIR